jgi:molecular chaperone GrpE
VSTVEFPRRSRKQAGQEATSPTGSENDVLPGPAREQALPPDLEDPATASGRGEDDRLGSIEEKLDGIAELLVSRTRYEESMERSFKMLYEDLQAAQPERVLEQYRPLYLDIILLLDRVEELLGDATVGGALQSVRDELLELLARRGVESIPESSDEFDATVMRAVGRSPTADVDLHGKVARRFRRGFRFDSRIIRHEQVAVWVPSEPASENS